MPSLLYHTLQWRLLLPSGPGRIVHRKVVQSLAKNFGSKSVDVELRRIELPTYSLRTNRSPKLSYSPNEKTFKRTNPKLSEVADDTKPRYFFVKLLARRALSFGGSYSPISCKKIQKFGIEFNAFHISLL